ncbi:hypothetical protein E0W68_06725 [Flavobacterium salilacus subsp. salilacus]|uniref:hypothetical protein n=1 Tax=Flavobacterium TaxID=237 RepID=UPI0010757CD2|nr:MULTISPECIES: hypothetical protein [Flavobacterium]KAF2518945.1 hypothetical protein E0W68_06725 [Flavobacterium salilacus subsp. salilacus]MBE1614893.1 hypothetical protein [Flavobacterium sp. SaA2.13]
MKTIGLFLLFAVSFITGGNNVPAAVDYDIAKKIDIAIIEKGNIKVLIDEKAFIEAVNNSSLVTKENRVHTFSVLKGISQGEAEKEFYYILLSSKEKNFNLVRVLYNRNGKLVMDQDDFEKEYYTYSYFVSCEGVDGCTPQMFYTDSQLMWSCSDKPVCVSPEEAKKNPCTKSTSLITED